MSTEQLAEFVKQFALTKEEARPLIQQAQDPHYWTTLCPAMTISKNCVAAAPATPDRGTLDAIGEYNEYGHCIVSEAFSVNDIDALKSGVFAVQEAGWPMIFASVYDQFWATARTPKLAAFVGALLGPSYQPTISFWVNHVPPRRGGSGFTPHLDDVRPGYDSVTCWLPLTQATPDNGCIYVIERGPGHQLPANFVGVESFTSAQVCRTLAHVRALPASPGAFLAWPNQTIHWGGMFLRGHEARLALTWHFTSADYENLDPALRLALVPGQSLPRFENRLRWACQSMMRFRSRDPVLERFAPVANHLIKACGVVL